MNKRIFFSLASLFLALGLSSQNLVNVRVAEGTLAGTDSSGVKIFKGVPFEPQPAVAWQGVKKATQFGPNPMQEPLFGDMNFGTKEMSEDCLYLNIWTPAKTMKEKLPVLIYFNGGGLLAGSGSEPRYAGQAMARKGVIAVTANYREGIFGFLSLPELSKESGGKGSGNYGLMDQAAAIQWVKNNIAAFGGDPNRITIAGESAGSVSVSALMASPMSKDLFAQAIGSSGSILGFRPLPTLKEAEAEGKKMMAKAGCRNLKALRAMPAEELMKKVNYRSMPTPCIDGRFFTEQPSVTFREGRQAHVSLLLGGNNQEMTLFAATVDQAKAMAQQVYGAATDSIFPLYGIETQADLKGRPGIDLASDLFLDFSTWQWGYVHAQTGGQPVYRYRYCHPPRVPYTLPTSSTPWARCLLTASMTGSPRTIGCRISSATTTPTSSRRAIPTVSVSSVGLRPMARRWSPYCNSMSTASWSRMPSGNNATRRFSALSATANNRPN